MTVALDLGSYSDISDYASLVAKARLWLDRGNELDDLIGTFVANAEGYLNRVLRAPEMEAFATPVTTLGAFTLPADCLQVRELTAGGRPLASTSPGALAQTYTAITGVTGTTGAIMSGCARAYAISGVQVQVAPVSTEALGLLYWQRIPRLSLVQPTNWLLDTHPDIYLYGTLFQANTYIADADAAAGWSAVFEGAVDQLVQVGKKARWGGPIVARAGPSSVRGIRA